MIHMRPLITGVVICDACGRPWELYRAHAVGARCSCGGGLTMADESPPRSNPFAELLAPQVAAHPFRGGHTMASPTRRQLEAENQQLRRTLEEIYERAAELLEPDTEDDNDNEE
jgi:hypothetical protein